MSEPQLHPHPQLVCVFAAPPLGSRTDVSLTAPFFLWVSPQKPAQPSPPPVSDWVTHSRHPQARLGNPFLATTVRDGAAAEHTPNTSLGLTLTLGKGNRREDECQQLRLLRGDARPLNVSSSFPVTVIADDMQEVKPRILGNIVVR